MDELPFLVVLIRRLRAAVIWTVAATFAVLLYFDFTEDEDCLLYTSPSPRDATLSRMPSSA